MRGLSLAPSRPLARSYPWRHALPSRAPAARFSFTRGCSSPAGKMKTLKKDVEEMTRDGYEGVVEGGTARVRLDVWLAREVPCISRGRVQASIQQGLARVNSQAVSKVSHIVKAGDMVECKFIKVHVPNAVPEAIPLDIVYEDKYLIVLNKPAQMVVHPAPGNPKGTLVNALLHHCGLPTIEHPLTSLSSSLNITVVDSDEDLDDDDDDDFHVLVAGSSNQSVRPGIVHRLDKGTSGLLVVAKDDYTHMQLCDQFKARTVQRSYVSLTCGTPSIAFGRVEAPIGRDSKDRKKMAVVQTIEGGRSARYAASRFNVLESLAGGGSALVAWKLETGRTHQIRVHAKHAGYPLLGDELYGGTAGAALSRLLPLLPSASHGPVRKLIKSLERPCLHAMTLGFKHPWTNQDLTFSCPPPQDFETTWKNLRSFGWSKTI